MYREFNKREREIADQVADDILVRERIFLWLFLLLFVLLVTFFSSLIFTRIAYYGKSTENFIHEDCVLFAYEEGSNNINITGAYPISDNEGKALNGEGEYFKFGIAITPSKKHQKSITYEISLTPNRRTLNPKYVRVYLVEGNKEVIINGKTVNNFSDLPQSNIRHGSKLLYKATLSKKVYKSYIFKMWLSSDYELKEKAETFSCYVNVDAY